MGRQCGSRKDTPHSLKIAYSIRSFLNGNDDALKDLLKLLDIKQSDIIKAE